jgi:hypothetical protein
MSTNQVHSQKVQVAAQQAHCTHLELTKYKKTNPEIENEFFEQNTNKLFHIKNNVTMIGL